jgi:hypothetical protein
MKTPAGRSCRLFGGTTMAEIHRKFLPLIIVRLILKIKVTVTRR